MNAKKDFMLEILYLIYIAFRFGLLAKRYSRNVYLWVVLSGIFYIVCLMFLSFNVTLFSTLKVLPSIEENNDQYMVWLPIIAGLLVAFGIHKIVEMSFQKDQAFEELDRTVEKKSIEPVPKPDYYYYFHQVNLSNVHHIRPLAEKIWANTYGEILSQDQIEYMIPMMYDTDKILQNVTDGQQWEILKVDNVSVGYLHYYIEEDSKIFLSKLYLDPDLQHKGLGFAMLQHVIDFGRKHQVNSIYLTVNRNNTKAIKFYERNGFSSVREEQFDIGNGYIMDDFIYQLSI